ncbi:MAG: mechanosensitive ion channel family protein, partial [Planctomycetota bacterium]
SLDLEIFVYIRTRDWSEFLSIREDIFLRIMDIVHASGTYFAFPSQTLYLGRDEGRDEERSARCEAEIRALREKGEFQAP